VLMHNSNRFGLRKILSIRLSAPMRLGLAIAVAAIAILLQLAFSAVWGSKLPLTLFLPAVIVSAAAGGFGPGILTTALSCAFAAGYSWMKRPDPGILSDPTDIFELILLAGIGIVFSAIVEAWRKESLLVAQHEEHLKATWTNVDDAVFTTDENGSITHMNPVAEALTGWMESEVRGRDAKDVFVTADNTVHRVLRDGKASGRINHTVLVSKTGREIPVDEIVTPIKGPDGHVTSVVIVFRDTRPRYKSEIPAAKYANKAADDTDDRG
jgi:PAS domain S-box-containing protein